MRIRSLMTALLLAGCSGGEARVALPLVAPEGADPVVKDFVEVCSHAMTEGLSARKEAVARGWAEMAGSDKMLEHGLVMLEIRSGDRQLQITETAYPHVRVRSCMLMQFYPNEPVDIAMIGKTAGLAGEITELPELDGTGSRGIWSFVGPEGDVVTINTTATPPRIVQLTMSTARRMSPPPKTPKT